jgi:predicted YcjX-like family ATPase
MARIGLYQPFIEDRNVRRLYRLKVEHLERTGRKVPMTALVNRILDDFFDGAREPVPHDDVRDAAKA